MLEDQLGQDGCSRQAEGVLANPLLGLGGGKIPEGLKIPVFPVLDVRIPSEKVESPPPLRPPVFLTPRAMAPMYSVGFGIEPEDLTGLAIRVGPEEDGRSGEKGHG